MWASELWNCDVVCWSTARYATQSVSLSIVHLNVLRDGRNVSRCQDALSDGRLHKEKELSLVADARHAMRRSSKIAYGQKTHRKVEPGNKGLGSRIAVFKSSDIPSRRTI